MADRPTHWYNWTRASWKVWGRWDERKDRCSVCECCYPAIVASANMAVAEESECDLQTTAWWMTWRAEAASVPKNLTPTHCSRTSNSSRESYAPVLAGYSTAVPAAITDKEAAMWANEPSSFQYFTFSTMVVIPRDWDNQDRVGMSTTLINQAVIPITTEVTPTTTTLEVQVGQNKENKNLYYRTIYLITKERPLIINLWNCLERSPLLHTHCWRNDSSCPMKKQGNMLAERKLQVSQTPNQIMEDCDLNDRISW